jgi:hypothetical protein
LSDEGDSEYTRYAVKSSTAGDIVLNPQSFCKYLKVINKPKKSMIFSEYMDIEQLFHLVRVHKDVNANNWMQKKIFCDCPSFQKDFLCKHCIGLAVKLKLAEVPIVAKNSATPIGTLPKRGRPSKAKKALTQQK